MDAQMNLKSTLERFFALLILVISGGLCILLVPGKDKGEIITLWASSNQPRQSNQANTSEQNNSENETVPVVQMQTNPSVNAVTEAAVKLGILSCVSRINQVAAFLSANNQAGVFIFKPKDGEILETYAV